MPLPPLLADLRDHFEQLCSTGSLDEYVRIEELTSNESSKPYDLAERSNSISRPGVSCTVYKIPSPWKDGEFLACKRIEDASSRLKEIKAETLALSELKGMMNLFAHLEAVFYDVVYDDGGLESVAYLVLSPWVELSLENFLGYLTYNSQLGAHILATEVPWYEDYEATIEPWPEFIGSCIAAVDILTNKLGLDTQDPLDPTPDPPLERIRHKDIKADNILLNPVYTVPHMGNGIVQTDARLLRLNPLLVDFGISKLAGDGTSLSQNAIEHDHYSGLHITTHQGTGAYLAPEQTGDHCPSYKSDIFSLGCCFAFLEAFMRFGRSGVLQIYEIAVANGRAFRDNLEQVNSILDKEPTWLLSPSMAWYLQQLRLVVKNDMLVMVSDRKDAGTLELEVRDITREYNGLRRHDKDDFTGWR